MAESNEDSKAKHPEKAAEEAPVGAAEPKDEAAEPKAKTVKPKAKAAEPKDEAAEPKAKAAKPKAKAAEPKAKTAKPKAKAAEPKAKTAKPKAKATAPKDEVAEPKDEAAAPKDKAAAPKDETAAPKDEAAEPKDEAAAPKDEAPKATSPSPAPPPSRTVPPLPADAHYIWGTGRRKAAVARVRIRPGSGNFLVNKRKMDEYFPRLCDQESVLAPLHILGMLVSYDVWVNVNGGGATGQAGAVTLGLARALAKHIPEVEHDLRGKGLLTRDARMKERKKPGQPGARKRFQFSKR